MILWITGNTGAGKTTLSKWITEFYPEAIVLDGNDLRKVWLDLDLSEEGRWEQNLRAARLANVLQNQVEVVVVAVICPYHDLRKEVQRICDCKFIYLYGGEEASEEYPYEYREQDEYEEEN